jgi:hypothetical protein
MATGTQPTRPSEKLRGWLGGTTPYSRLTAPAAAPWDEEAGKVRSYTTLQLLVGIIALALPVVLFVGHFFFADSHLPGSMSAFYYTPLHAYFTGSLCALGLVLFTYKYAPQDNWLSSVAGVLIVIVALCPTAPEGRSMNLGNYIHLGTAFIFLSLLAYFSLVLFTNSKASGGMSKQKKRRNRIYVTCGIFILVAVILAAVLAKSSLHWLFWWETIAVVAFSISWLVKGLGGQKRLPAALAD